MTRQGGDWGADALTALRTSALLERRSAKWRTHGPDVLPVWLPEMDTPLADPIKCALNAAVERGDTGYAEAGHLADFFADFAHSQWGWRPDPAGVRIVPDVVSGIVEMLYLLTGPGDRVVTNTPAYPEYFSGLERTGRELVASPLAYGRGCFRLDLDRLERDFAAGAAVYLLCNPHNPTGLVFSRVELLAVAALADRYGVRVITDEIHAPLTYKEAQHIPFASLDAPAAARSVGMYSASIAWNLPGLKASLVVAGPEATEETSRMPSETTTQVGLFGLIASEAAFREGGPWLENVLIGLDANRRLLAGLLADELPEVTYHLPQATYVGWLDCRPLGLGDDPADIFLREGAVALMAGPPFGPSGDGFVGFNFATSPERVTDAVHRMTSAARKSR